MDSHASLFASLSDNIFFIAMWSVLALFVASIVVGAIVIMRNHARKNPFEGKAEFDLEKIAEELDAEIANLKDLRNRILPYRENQESVETLTAPEVDSSVSKASLSASINNADPAVVQEFQQKISELEKRLAEAQAQAAQGAETINDTGGRAPQSAEEKAKVEQESKELIIRYNKLEEELKELKRNKDHLEKIVSEYQLFEEDFALVKKYKTENEELRKRLMEKEGLSAEAVDKLLTDSATPPAAAPISTTPASDKSQELHVSQNSESTPSESTTIAGDKATPSEKTIISASENEAESNNTVVASSDRPAPEIKTEADPEALAEAEASADIGSDLSAVDAAVEKSNTEPIPDAQSAIDDVFAQAQAAAASGGSEIAPATDKKDATNVPKEASQASSNEDELMAEFEKLLSEKT